MPVDYREMDNGLLRRTWVLQGGALSNRYDALMVRRLITLAIH